MYGGSSCRLAAIAANPLWPSYICMSSNFHCQSARTKRQFLYLITGCALFVVLSLGALVYGVSRPQTDGEQEGERDAIRKCRLRSESVAMAPTSRRFQVEACQEMEKQFRSKFRQEP